MPISPRAAQQIADLLIRAGVPENTALDVAQRLLSESANPANFRTLNGDRANVIGPQKFQPREQVLPAVAPAQPVATTTTQGPPPEIPVLECGGKSICDILEEMQKSLVKLEKRVKVIEDLLANTVECSVD